eukprot:c5074_g1_i1.p1 GENE.c5074_g1_i1~~c5074_g1_i1.p1  ORF type:complete len:347 (+),score=70.60 c5074_g1_i1:60-1100(+)
MAANAEKAFAEYNWGNDNEWQEKLQKIELPADDEDVALLKLKRKYFKAKVDPELEIQGSSARPQEEQKATPRPSAPTPSTPTPKPTQPTSSSSKPTTSSGTSSSSKPSSSRPRSSAPPPSWKSIQGVGFALNSLVVFFSLISIFSDIAYRLALVNGLVSFTLSLWSSQLLGRSLFSREGVARFLMNDTAQYALYCLIHLPFSNVFVAALPIATIALVHVCNFLLAIGLQNISPFLSKYEPQMTMFVAPHTVQKLVENNALTEVVLVFVLLFQAFVGRTGLMHMFLHLQFLRFKYMTSAQSRNAWSTVSGYFDKVFHHRLCPSVIGNLFDRARNAFHKYATSGQAVN